MNDKNIRVLEVSAWVLAATLFIAGAVFVLLTRAVWASTYLWLALILAVASGIAIRILRAPRGRRLRDGFGPAAGAAEVYQQLLMSREPTSQLIQEAFPTAMDETNTSEPPKN